METTFCTKLGPMKRGSLDVFILTGEYNSCTLHGWCQSDAVQV